MLKKSQPLTQGVKIVNDKNLWILEFWQVGLGSYNIFTLFFLGKI
jgi:hypothetical protein